MPDDLRPPEAYAHFRWHWLIVDDGIANGPMPAEWTGDKWMVLGFEDATPKEATEDGWRYHGICDPAALTITPDDPKQIECVARTLWEDQIPDEDWKDTGWLLAASLCGFDGDMRYLNFWGQARAVLKALSDAREK